MKTVSISGSGAPVDLVLQGGGIKAIALVGALAALEVCRFRPRRMAATSAGAIVAGLTAAGYSPSELRRIIATEPFPDYLDARWYARVPGIGRPLALVWRMGLHKGDRLQRRLAELLTARGVQTFGDLTTHRLSVIVSDVTARRILVLPRDAGLFGIEPRNLSVALALRMSAGIPAIYEPVRLTCRDSGRKHLLVDGGMLSNFPLWVFDDCSDPEVPVIGLRLVDDAPRESLAERLPVPALSRTRAGQFVDYVESLARTMMEAHDRRYLDAGASPRTIEIPVPDIAATQFDLSIREIGALYEAGYRAALNSLAPANRLAGTMVG